MTLNKNRLIATKKHDSKIDKDYSLSSGLNIRKSKKTTIWLVSSCFVFASLFSSPKTTEASILSSILSIFNNAPAVEASASTAVSSVAGTNSNQVLEAAISSDPSPSKLEAGPVLVSDSALLSESGPIGAVGNVDTTEAGQISVYTVHEGDSLGTIAKMFDVSVNTIIWANDVTAKTLRVGQNLIILPVSGVQYTVKKGDTIKSIANKFKGDMTDILVYNGLTEKTILAAGDEIIIPDGEMSTYVSTPSLSVPGAAKNPTSRLREARADSLSFQYRCIDTEKALYQKQPVI
jgi:LysM repeat protein